MPSWRKDVERVAPLFGSVRLRELPDFLTARGAEIVRQLTGSTIPTEHLARVLSGPLGASITVALLEAGWQACAGVGEPVTLSRDGEVIEPLASTSVLVGGGADAKA